MLKKEKSAEKVNEKISSALNYSPESASLAVLKNRYDKSLSNNEDWEAQYQWLVKFVKEYENYAEKVQNESDGVKRRNMRAKLKKYDELYDQLSPVASIAETSLRQIIGENVGTANGGNDGQFGPTPEDVNNANKIAETERRAREDSELKAKTEREATEFAKQKRTEEEKTAAAVERQVESEKKLLLYRRVEGEFNPALLGNQSADALYDVNHTPIIQNALEDEFAGFGDGIFASPLSGAQDLVPFLADGKVSFFEFDASKYKLYVNQTVEQAEILREFLSSLQKLVGNGTILDGSKLTKIEDLTEDELFDVATKLFTNFEMTKEQFHTWVVNAKNECENIANLFAQGKVPEDHHNFGTRFMKALGYEGVLNATGDQGYDGNYQGSVIYDPDVKSIENSAVVFKSTSEYLAHLKEMAQNTLPVVQDVNSAIQENTSARSEASAEDDAETITQENGKLEDKLELLRDIADQYASNITQRQRDRYEELNQKDMDSGLSTKEEERYYELGEQIDAADGALEEFGQTYDKIILKLANGKKVEMLPDDKGLRSLYKFADEYGETYGGIEIEDVVFERVKKEADAHQQNTETIKAETKAQEELNAAKAQNGTGIQQETVSSSAGDASSSELASERKKVEALQAENVALQDRLQKQVDEAADEAYRNQQARAELYDQISDAEERARKATEESTIKGGMIQELREQLANVKTGIGDASDKSSVNTEELKNVLNSITYNVKVIQDTENTDNKVAIDETSLESTLNKVFANVINRQTQQNDGEQNQSPWALESTLQTVKGVLDNIQKSTSRIGTVKAPNVDTIAGTALDGRLTEIKSVLESINDKIAKGGIIATRGAVKQANADAQGSQSKTQAVRSNMMKSIMNDYETLGRLSAQFDSDNNLETKARLDNLKEEIRRKRASLKITTEENAVLREKYSISFDAQKRLLDAAKAQRKINDQNKADNKSEEAVWKQRVKDAQRATGINAATSAANAGDQTVLRAIGTDGISKDIEAKARDLSDRIEVLRNLRDEINKKGTAASEEDRDNLSKQISKVKELKSEVDGYLKIHEKYSGDNATDLGDGSGFGAVGTDEYWNKITAAVQAQAQGRVVIQGMNADTGELTGTTKIAANTFATWSATVDPLTGRLSILRTGIKKTETIIESITRKTKEIFTYFSGSSIIFKFFNELKKGIQYVKEIDLALTELKKVTDETEETYDKFLQTAAKTGSEIGSTISDVTLATATFAKLGYNITQASEMAKAALVYQNVGDGIASADEAAESIISTMKGFGLQASESMRIVDSFNEVGNRFSITSKGIGEALKRSASALAEGGNSLDESIGIITAANEVVQDPESVGK